jgi:23S rRNA (guanosine2251-2'-O)-methyltransferase
MPMMARKECILILDNIRSVENVGSIFRSAESFGVERVVLVGITPAPVDRFGRKRKDFAKVALGTEEIISYEVGKSISKVIEELKKDSYKIIALEQHPKAQKLGSYEVGKLGKFVLIVGNEVEGVSQEALKLADEIVEIPMMGRKESLNVSVATGVALFRLLFSDSVEPREP